MVDDVFLSSRIDGLTRAQRLANAAFSLGQEYEIQRAQLRAEFDQRLQLLAASIVGGDPELMPPAVPLPDIPDATLLELFKLPPGRPVRPDMRTSSDGFKGIIANPPYIERTEPETPKEICKAPAIESPPSPSWTTLKAAFFKDKPGLAKKTHWSYNQAFDDWLKLIGEKPISEVKRADLKAYADYLRDRESGRGGMLNRKTIVRSLGHIKTFMYWAANSDLAIDDGFGKVRAREKTSEEKFDEDPRRAFTNDELRLLFNSAIIRYPRTDDDWCWRWFLLAALMTGGRTKELARAPSKLVRLEGVHCLDLRAGKKTTSAPRLVPICLELERLGFIEWADERSKRGQLLFQTGQSVKTPGAWSKSLNRFINEQVADDPTLTLYSLRHNFRQMERSAGLSDELMNKIFGHKMQNVGEKYGRTLSAAEAGLFLRTVRAPISLDFLLVP